MWPRSMAMPTRAPTKVFVTDQQGQGVVGEANRPYASCTTWPSLSTNSPCVSVSSRKAPIDRACPPKAYVFGSSWIVPTASVEPVSDRRTTRNPRRSTGQESVEQDIVIGHQQSLRRTSLDTSPFTGHHGAV